ncbi:hypothetical protein JCM11491_004480 [Sporobolomyces phaffii]
MSYDPYSSSGPQGGYVPPPNTYGGPPPPPQFQPDPHSRRDPSSFTDRYSAPHDGGYSNEYRGRPAFSPPPTNADQGWNARGGSAAPRRRSASPTNRYGDDSGGYRNDRGYRGGRGGASFGGPRGGGPGRAGGDAFGRRREDDDASSFLSDRAKQERPGRILFVRNLKFGVTSDEVRSKFAEIGDIKTFFDLVEKRAMAFVTYFDARAAMMAKDRLDKALLQGRPMDVHFSLPRDADMAQECDREKGQGTLSLVILPFPGARIHQALPPPTDDEVFSRFSPFGDIKQVFPSYKRPEMRYIEFFDSRGTVLAYDQVHGSRMAGGIADLRFVWDKYPMDQSRPPPGAGAARRNDRFEPLDNRGPPPPSSNSSYGSGPDRYGPPQGAGYNAGPPPGPSGYGAPPPQAPYGNYAGPPPPRAGPGFDGPPPGAYGGSAPPPPSGPGAPPSAYGYDNRPPLSVGPPSSNSPYDRNPYQQGAPPLPPPANIPPPETGHGVEQAKKMQDLLASLMANPNALSNVLPPSSAAAAPPIHHSPSLQAPPVPPPVPASDGGGGGTPLPPAVSSLLAQAGVPQARPPSASVQSPPRVPVAPQHPPPPPAGQEPVANSQVQALLALLASQKAQSN